MNRNESYQKPYRSFFWPVIMMGVGMIWLLVNLGILPSTNLWILLRLWPVLIILAGLDVLFARRLSFLGALLALLLLGGVIFILINGESLNLGEKPEPIIQSISAPLDDAETANFELDLSTQKTTIYALEDSNNLVEAEIGHYGRLDFRVTGEEEKWITLQQEGILSLPSLFPLDSEELVWDIGLSPNVPFDLKINASTGETEINLSDIILTNLRFDGSTGASQILLPGSSTEYDVYIEGSTGGIALVLPDDGIITLRVDGSTGRITFDIPEGVDIRIEVLNGGTGNIILPGWISKVEGARDRDEGIYASDGGETADQRISITIEDIGTGNIVFK